MPLRYFGLRVRDLDRSLRFYTKALRLKEVRRGDLREFGLGIWVLLQDPRTHQRLELNWYPKGSKFATPYAPGEALDHLGFLLGRVPERALRAEHARLLRAGARPASIAQTGEPDGWVAYVLDPDGNCIEIFRWPTVAEVREERRRQAAARSPPKSGPRPRRKKRS